LIDILTTYQQRIQTAVDSERKLLESTRSAQRYGAYGDEMAEEEEEENDEYISNVDEERRGEVEYQLLRRRIVLPSIVPMLKLDADGSLDLTRTMFTSGQCLHLTHTEYKRRRALEEVSSGSTTRRTPPFIMNPRIDTHTGTCLFVFFCRSLFPQNSVFDFFGFPFFNPPLLLPKITAGFEFPLQSLLDFLGSTKEKLNGTLPPAIHTSLMTSFGAMVTMNMQLSSSMDLWHRKRAQTVAVDVGGGEEEEEEMKEEIKDRRGEMDVGDDDVE
jgi:hypothetical protein